MTKVTGGECGKCGAVKVDQQMGLEKTPGEFVEKMVEVFREVRRVLKKDGTCWVNLGDSYASQSSGSAQSGMKALSDKYSPRKKPRENHKYQDTAATVARPVPEGLKPKDLCGIPWRVALALQADGWWLRADIIWHKPNPMPESCTDRPTKAHEYLFLLTKGERYYYDAEAIKEPTSPNTNARLSQNLAAQIGSFRANGGNKTNGPMKAVGRRGKEANPDPMNRASSTMREATLMPVTDRNSRDVWTEPEGEWEQFQQWKAERAADAKDVWSLATQPFKEAHFATFPANLAKRCILAGTKAGEVVLGSGTTAMVALELGRQSVTIELNSEYVKLIEQRCNVTPGMF